MGWLIQLLPLAYTEAVVVVAGAVLGITAGVLGSFAVLRGRSMLGDAVAHATLPGVCAAFLLTGSKDVPQLLFGAAVAGVLASLAMVGLERYGRQRPDAAIGVVLSGSFCLGLVLLTSIAGRGDADQAGLQNYLFGQAAGLLERDVALMAGVALVALGLAAVSFRALKTTLFDPQFAAAVGLPVRAVELLATTFMVVAVVIGVRLVGAILMVAMLVVPTVAARQFTDRLAPMLVLAGVIGAGVGVTGALVSTRAALPTGPVIVLVGSTVVAASLLLAPGRGVLAQAARLLADRRRAAAENRLLGLQLTPATSRAERAELAALLQRRALWSAWLEHGHELDLPDAREADPRDLAGSLGPDAVARLQVLAASDTNATLRVDGGGR